MNDEYTDIVTLHVMDAERRVRLGAWTPSAAYDPLMEAVLQAGVDLDEYSDGSQVGIATVTEGGDVLGFTEGTECDHSATERLVTNQRADSEYWPVSYDEEPKSGLKQNCRCSECGEAVEVFYRIDEIRSSEGLTQWAR